MQDLFDRVVCINLDRRKERWRRFQANIQSCDWPFHLPERFRAIDGHVVPPPVWWRAGKGAWGNHQGHIRILQEAIQDGIESILILEDDAVFPARFPERLEPFLSQLPDDWDGLMFGGQHLKPPIDQSGCVVQVKNGNRTHAHALRGEYINVAYQHLSNYPDHAKKPGHHVDHRFGILHESGKYKVYAPRPWLVGQDAGSSDVTTHKGFSLRFWNDSVQPEKLPPFVAVIGLHCSGSSCLAGVLHHLGVHMGNVLTGYCKQGGFEAQNLARLCERAYPFPTTELKGSRKRLIADLRVHIREKRLEAHWKNTIAGGKYPHLCALGDELLEAMSGGGGEGGGLKFIHIDRPLEDSIASLKRRSTEIDGWLEISDEQAETVQEWLWERKRELLARVEHMTVGFDDLLAAPSREVDRIAEYLEIEPNSHQFDAAIAHVHVDHKAIPHAGMGLHCA